MTKAGRLAGLCLAAALAGCAPLEPAPATAPDERLPADTAELELQVGARATRELCFEAAAGELVTYRFEATGPLEFNLHYHRGDTVYYPVPAHGTAAEKGQYRVPADQVYCLMWTNAAAAPVHLTTLLIGGGEFTVH